MNIKQIERMAAEASEGGQHAVELRTDEWFGALEAVMNEQLGRNTDGSQFCWDEADGVRSWFHALGIKWWRWRGRFDDHVLCLDAAGML